MLRCMVTGQCLWEQGQEQGAALCIFPATSLPCTKLSSWVSIDSPQPRASLHLCPLPLTMRFPGQRACQPAPSPGPGLPHREPGHGGALAVLELGAWPWL